VTEVASSAPAGWYPDPTAPSNKRWWSGSAWTEQTWVDEPVIPQRPRLAGNTASDAVAAAVLRQAGQKDPYRARNPLPMIAFVIAVAGGLVTLLSLAVPMPTLLVLLASGGTGGFGTLALLSSIHLGTGMRLSIAAVVIGGISICLGLVTGLGL
jgi:hypothetical protein